MRTRRLALTLFLIVALLITSPGFGVVFAAGPATAARVDVTIAAGETADVVIVMKPASIAGLAAGSVVGSLKAQAVTAQSAAIGTVLSGGGKVLNTFWLNNSVLAKVDSATLSKLAKTPGVDRIIPNFKVYALSGTPSAPAAAVAPAVPPAATWGLQAIHAPESWTEFGVNGSGVRVAVLDTGIDPTHPDIAGKLAAGAGGWAEFAPDGSRVPSAPWDSGSHGTHVSGTIVGGSASGTAIGVAPGATLMSGMVLSGVSGTFAMVVGGMEWAMDPRNLDGSPAGPPADVVNMSLGTASTAYVTEFVGPIYAMKGAGIAPVVAIGNFTSGEGNSSSPGNIYKVWSVGAFQLDGSVTSVAGFSGGEVVNKSDFASPPADWPGSWVKPEVVAPGVNVMSSVPGGGYESWDGTSMATPHAAGTAALLIQYMRSRGMALGGVDLETMYNAMRDGAVDMGERGSPDKDIRWGFGQLCARMSLQRLAGGGSPPPGGTPTINAASYWPDPVRVVPGEPGPYEYNYAVGNTGTANLNYSIHPEYSGGPSGWLFFPGGPPTGVALPSTTQTYSLSVTPLAGLPPGEYSADVVINSNDPSTPEVRLPIRLQWGADAPRMWLDPEGVLHFNVERGQESDTQTILIGNDGTANLDWTISDRFAKGAPGGMSTSSMPKPQGSSEARSLPGNKAVGSSAVKPASRPSGGAMFEGDYLVIGVSDFGELNWADPGFVPPPPPGSPPAPPPPPPPSHGGMGYGFEYKPARTSADYGSFAESIATGWNGEGYVVYYDGRTVSSYPDAPPAGIVKAGKETLRPTPDEIKHKVNVKTDDNRVAISYSFRFNTHDRKVIVTAEFKNTGPAFIGDLRYKRVIDWDANAGAADDIMWSYNQDYNMVSTIDPPGGGGSPYPAGRYFAYGMAAMGDSWPMIYDWDLNAWDDYMSIDHGGSWMQNGPDDPANGDLNGAIYFALGSLAPGEVKVVNMVYTVGEGDTPEDAYTDLLSNLGGGGSSDVPWLFENPSEGTIEPGMSQGVDIVVDARGLDIGRYHAELVVTSNDPAKRSYRIPVEVNVAPPLRVIITDPEDQKEGNDGRKVDISEVRVQATRDTLMFVTKFYGELPIDSPVVSVLMLDADEDSTTGYTGPFANDIGADYMAFGFAYANAGPESLKAARAADLSKLARRLPGVDTSRMKAAMVKAASAGAGGPGGQLFLFSWNRATRTWSPLMETYNIGLNGGPDGASMFQILYLVTMVDDGAMKVVQSAGGIWDINDTGPNHGHGSTIPATDIAITGLTADVAAAFLTGQEVLLTATVKNEGDEALRDVVVSFSAYPILREVATSPGEEGYPNPKLELDDPITLGEALIERLNPGTEADAQLGIMPELVPDPRPAGNPHRDPSGFIHDYLVVASVPVSPKESNADDNEKTLKISLEVGAEVALSDLQVSDVAPSRAGSKAVDTVYTGVPHWVSVTVTNNGALDLPDDYSVTFYFDGEAYGDPVLVGPLGSGDTSTITIEWTPEAVGDNFSIEAQGSDLPGQMNYDDDVASATVDVEAGTDVSVASVGISPAAPVYGGDVTLTANVANVGHLPLSGVMVNFLIGESLVGNEMIESLAPGANANVSAIWTADFVGRVNVTVRVEPVPFEANLANNTRTTNFNVSGKDIGVTSITVTPPTGLPKPKKGRVNTVKVTVQDLGTTTESLKTRLSWSTSGTGSWTAIGTPQSILSLRPGTNKVLTFNWTPSGAGSLYLKAELGGSTTSWSPWSDINSANDVKTQIIMVDLSITDVSVRSVDVAPISTTGKASPVKVTVANDGNERASFTLELYANGKSVKSVPVAGLMPSASRTVPIIWTPKDMGSYAITAKVRDGDLPDDTTSRSFETSALALVPMSLKVTASDATPGAPNPGTRLDIQLMDASGKTPLAVSGLRVKIDVPAGVVAPSSSLTTDASGKASTVLTPLSGKKTVTVTISIDGVAKKTVTITL